MAVFQLTLFRRTGLLLFGVLAIACKPLIYKVTKFLLYIVFLFHSVLTGTFWASPLLFTSSVTSAITSFVEIIFRSPNLFPGWVLYLTETVNHHLGGRYSAISVRSYSTELSSFLLALPFCVYSFPFPGGKVEFVAALCSLTPVSLVSH